MPFVYLVRCSDQSRQIKGWTSRKKEALIAGEQFSLKRLSKRHH
jgi:predicted GIY-YIG superfamily endonuclease